MNTGIRELYLADNNLNLYDAIQLGSLLRLNNHIQLLDVRYVQIKNNIEARKQLKIKEKNLYRLQQTFNNILHILFCIISFF